MESMPAPAGPVTVGVDTHLETHVAAVVDQTGRLCGTQAFAASTRGYVALVTWAEGFGPVERIGIEGTGTYGAGLARFARAYGLQVLEVDRPDRSTRRRHGKSDPIDAQAAARATLAGVAATTPKTRDGQVEMIRVLRVARRGALKARVAAAEQLHGVLYSAPEELRQPLLGLKTKALVNACAAMRPRPLTSTTAATKTTLRTLARRWQHLQGELDQLDRHLGALVASAAPSLLTLPGIGIDTAGQLLVTAPRPAAMPTGRPARAATSAKVVACQATVWEIWPRVKPRVLSMARSRRRRRTEVTSAWVTVPSASSVTRPASSPGR
jgi:transposase